ncbi:low-density lipoprotein receptor-related protein 8-like [Stegodyphus dumicola]|uniref:low-density lipoprotein receptor-related protein 8-like n=1 Tax=Stegodyphus dumicola TaxID=202533 RepID=UPI0015A7E27E|nr:low-density lipoprotein receptor-related protein 8-like [Stegodyphus dumicola]
MVVFKYLLQFSSINKFLIYSAPIETGSPVTEIITDKIITPDGLAVDWIHGNIYWTDTGKNTLSVANLDGKMRKVLFGTHLDEPRAIVVSPLEGWMFWADWGEPSKIERAGMDGTHRSTIISKDIRWPNGLTVDLTSQKLFWADAKFHVLCSANYDGSNQRVILSSVRDVKHPFSLDVFEDWLYWTDWESESIYKAEKFSGQNVQSVVNGVSSPMGLRVYHSYKQPKGPNHCMPNNGGCSHLCLPSPKVTEGSAKFTCACPDGLVMADDMLHCIADELPVTKSSSSVRYSSTQKYMPFSVPTPAPTQKPSPTTVTVPHIKSYTYSTMPKRNNTDATSSSSRSTVDSAPTVAVVQAVSYPTQQSMLMNETLREIQEEIDDSGRIAGIIIGVLGGLTIVFALVGFCVYKQYLRRNITSMNFDNPVYRKTTEDQFSLEKNQYQPAKSYPSSLEPLTSPGTNEFV